METEKRARLVKVDEVQFLTCIKHSLWGSKRPRFRRWGLGDSLFFIVGRSIAGYATVVSEPFQSQDQVWDRGLFPHRIRIEFSHTLRFEHRPPVFGAVRDALVSNVGRAYGWAILNQQALPQSVAQVLFVTLLARPNDLVEMGTDIDGLLKEARAKRDEAAARRTHRR